MAINWPDLAWNVASLYRYLRVMMIRIPTWLLAMSLFNLSVAQNLVPNPSFENFTSTFCGIMGPGQYEQTINDWISPTDATPAAFFTNIDPSCYNFQPLSLYDGPVGIKGSQLPRTGNVMAGLWLYTFVGFNQRQYLQVALDPPMQTGSTYVVEFHVSLADSMESYLDRIGAHLSTSPISSSGDGPLDYNPQINADGFISEAGDWVSISDTIVAEEDHAYLTIGNFFDDLATSTLPNPLASNAVSTYGAFYFIDDVRIEELGPLGMNSHEPLEIGISSTLVNDQLELILSNEYLPSLLQVVNSSGQLVMVRQLVDEHNPVHLSNLPEGLYVLNVRSKNSYWTRKVIISGR